MKVDYTRASVIAYAKIVANYAKKLGLPCELFNLEREVYKKIIKSFINSRTSTALFPSKALVTFIETNHLREKDQALLYVVDYSLALISSNLSYQERLDWVFSHKEEEIDAGLGHQFTTIRVPVIKENKACQWYYPSFEYRIIHKSFPQFVCQKESIREAANSLIDQIKKTHP